MGDTFLLLMQYQHCRNCLWYPPLPSYSIISSPSVSLFELSLIDPHSFFAPIPIALTSVYIYPKHSLSAAPFFFDPTRLSLSVSLISGRFTSLAQLTYIRTELYSAACVYRARPVPSFWVSGTCWEKLAWLILPLLCHPATCSILTWMTWNNLANRRKEKPNICK